MCLLIIMGILDVERIVDGQARTYHTSQFWVVFVLIIWQKFLVLFIYDFKVRFAACLFLYTYFAFRVSGQEFRWIDNLLKASVYIILELVMVIDKELTNYADYQLENNIFYKIETQIHTKQVIQEVVPPMRMFQQKFLLESYLKVFPVVIIDQTKEILNISSETLKLLSQNDIFQAEKQLRKLEIIEVFNRKEQLSTKELIVKLTRQAKLGSTCGVNEKGDLLHSLINGLALQQLRQQQQVDQPKLQIQGQLEQLLNELVKGDQEYLKVNQCQNLVKKICNNKIYLFLDDVSEIVKLQMKTRIKMMRSKIIEQTKDGFFGITIENDARPNCIQISIQDTGKGINLDELKYESGTKLSGLFIANYLTKILGVSFFNKKINRHIANKGLRIITTQEYGTKISFTVRNMMYDQNNVQFLLDENLDEDDQNQDEIIEGYIVEDQTQYLNRLKKKSSLSTRRQNNQKTSIKRYDERLKSLTTQMEQIQFPQKKCMCENKLIINSDYQFTSILRDLISKLLMNFKL
ncbi:unnamed protein product [Paramecium pentaurelia]|uniref:Uncharacterized protein n=1 Tax=Paramecium pentaurelia TaxID=43138 RepID=A0A8S1Y096_9CILI|nr:unnamed protein product [Paramecium pentaurelia]